MYILLIDLRTRYVVSPYSPDTTLSTPRICIPVDQDSLSGIRLICETDAAINAGGAPVYAGRKLKDSTWSCALVASKSKLMKATVPRNELSVIMLGTDLIYLVAKSIGSGVEDVIFATDSTIALSWCFLYFLEWKLSV